jgi:hypothetical protein
MSVISRSLGMTPASEFSLALIMTITRIVVSPESNLFVTGPIPAFNG